MPRGERYTAGTSPISPRFRPGTEGAENVAGGPVRPCLYERPTDASNIEPGDAGVCRPARLDKYGTCEAPGTGTSDVQAGLVVEAARHQVPASHIEQPGPVRIAIRPSQEERRALGEVLQQLASSRSRLVDYTVFFQPNCKRLLKSVQSNCFEMSPVEYASGEPRERTCCRQPLTLDRDGSPRPSHSAAT
jgi:hypothetical protein